MPRKDALIPTPCKQAPHQECEATFPKQRRVGHNQRRVANKEEPINDVLSVRSSSWLLSWVQGHAQNPKLPSEADRSSEAELLVHGTLHQAQSRRVLWLFAGPGRQSQGRVQTTKVGVPFHQKRRKRETGRPETPVSSGRRWRGKPAATSPKEQFDQNNSPPPVASDRSHATRPAGAQVLRRSEAGRPAKRQRSRKRAE